MKKHSKMRLERRIANIVLPGAIALSLLVASGCQFNKYFTEKTEYNLIEKEKGELSQDIEEKTQYQKIKELSQNPNCFADYTQEISQDKERLKELEENSLPRRGARGAGYLLLGLSSLLYLVCKID